MRASRHWPTARDFADWPASAASLVEQRTARFPSRRRRTGRQQKQRFKTVREREAEVSTRFAENVLDATNAFALYIDRPCSARRSAGRCPADVPRGGRGGGSQRLQDHAAVSELFGDPRLRRRSRAARAALSRLRDARVGTRQSGLEQRPADGRAPALRQEHARLLGYRSFAEVSLVPKMAATPGRSAALPARPRRAGAALRRARRGGTARSSRPSELGLADVHAVGLQLRERKAARGALRLLRPGAEALLHRAARAGRPVQGDRDAVRGGDPRRADADLASGRALFSDRESSAANWSDSSTSTCTRATTSRAAPGRTMRAADAVAAPGWRLRCRT